MGQMPVAIAYNSAGRVRVRTTAGDCVGRFQLRGDAIATRYDPGQSGCVDATDRVVLLEGGSVLRFQEAVYHRRNRIDDLTF